MKNGMLTSYREAAAAGGGVMHCCADNHADCGLQGGVLPAAHLLPGDAEGGLDHPPVLDRGLAALTPHLSLDLQPEARKHA